VPVAWQAFLDYRVRATGLSRLEADLVRALAAGDPASAIALVEAEGLLERDGDGRAKPNFERREIEEKLKTLGWDAPWA
jgi:thymidylate synthase (FAD)